MIVCLCFGITNHVVVDAVRAGASTSKQVARDCDAGSQCGRCRHTIRAIIDGERRAEAAADDSTRS
ncbi:MULTISPECIES: bacterioferritin-associated ferredoxin [unclassified Mycobacterium]|uniref:(2Fe-2S)-binding protein n=1 Tax=unclassified Mycobacterium TaxID=2642494 RepID=UPI0029C7CF1F|nr:MULTISPECIES: (2Fe-2S)-binding protein [unclassified Mycobacterium]